MSCAVTMPKGSSDKCLLARAGQLVTFGGGAGGESVGIVDLLAVRKHHRELLPGAKRGDRLQIILIQVKGGKAAMPTEEDGRRLRIVAKHPALGRCCWQRGAREQPHASFD